MYKLITIHNGKAIKKIMDKDLIIEQINQYINFINSEYKKSFKYVKHIKKYNKLNIYKKVFIIEYVGKY